MLNSAIRLNFEDGINNKIMLSGYPNQDAAVSESKIKGGREGVYTVSKQKS